MNVNLLAGIDEASHHQQSFPLRAPRILVMDSGLGGLTVYQSIAQHIQGTELIYLADNAGFPYGRLSSDTLIERVRTVVGKTIQRHSPDIVVIACNTASTMVLPVLRAAYPIPVVGTVPAVKPAAEISKSRCITVLATPGTVVRDYTRELVARYAAGCQVTLVGAPRLASFAEAELAGSPVSDTELLQEISPCFVRSTEGATDVVVLACTHYPLLRHRLEKLMPWPVTFIDPAPAIARRVAALTNRNEENVVLPPLAIRPPVALFTQPVMDEAFMRQALKSRGIDDLRVEAIPFG